MLSIVLNPRFVGHVALDGFGVVGRSFRTWNLRRFGSAKHRAAAFARQVTVSIRRYHPTVAVLGRGPDLPPGCAQMLALGADILKSAGVDVVVRSSCEPLAILVGRRRQLRRIELAEWLVQNFFPDLRRHLARTGERERYRRTAWQALGLALVELTSRAPLAGAALMQAGANAVTRFSEHARQALLRADP